MYDAKRMAELDAILIRNGCNVHLGAMRVLLMLHPDKDLCEIPEPKLITEYAALYFAAMTPTATALLWMGYHD